MKKGVKGIKDITGFRFGMVKILSFAYYLKKSKKSKRRSFWNCLCNCGKEFIACRKNIVESKYFSCGCVPRMSINNELRSEEEQRNCKMNCLMNLSHWEKECLIWDGCTYGFSVPRCSYLNKSWAIKSLLWFFKYGKIIRYSHIKNICKNNLCINIEHLKIKTKEDVEMSPSVKEISGLKKDMITVISFSYSDLKTPKSSNTTTYWHCLCDCGNKIILSKPQILYSKFLSCGCKFKLKGKLYDRK